MRRNKRADQAKKLYQVRVKYADHPYLDNIMKRVRYEESYRLVKIRHQNSIVCVYCGMKATGVDHHPPLSRMEQYLQYCKIKELKPNPLKISCCAECNRLLGNTYHLTIEARHQTIRNRLGRKYHDIDQSDKLAFGRLRRRLCFNVGVDRIKTRYI